MCQMESGLAMAEICRADRQQKQKNRIPYGDTVFSNFEAFILQSINVGGTDGTRTRDPLRDRQVF